MNTQELHKRIDRIEEQAFPNQNRGLTLEDVAYLLWVDDRAAFSRLVENGEWRIFRHFIPEFERESSLNSVRRNSGDGQRKIGACRSNNAPAHSVVAPERGRVREY